jgi:hypothetical protein
LIIPKNATLKILSKSVILKANSFAPILAESFYFALGFQQKGKYRKPLRAI